jgi:acyl carrier protein
MTPDEIMADVFAALARIAPEARRKSIRGDAPLRDQLDLDSMDFLNLLVALHKRTGVEIPEADYARIATIDQLVAYIAQRQAS